MNNKINASVNSSCLEEFRKRKNASLAAEIAYNDDVIPHDPNLTKNSAYLELFRRRKNKQLAAELNIVEETAMNPYAPQNLMGESFRDATSEGRYDRDAFGTQRGVIPPKREPRAVLSQENIALSEQPMPQVKEKKKKNIKFLVVISMMVLSICVILFFTRRKNTDDLTAGEYDLSQFDYTVSDSDSSDNSVSSDEVGSDPATTESSDNNTETTAKKTTTTTAPELKTLRPGAENDEVLRMQKRLAELGYMSQESCTGYYGDYTKKKVKAFQKNAGLKQTGIADVKTLKRLYADDAPKN